MIALKRLLKHPCFVPQCCSCMRTSEDCRAVEISTEYSYNTSSVILCKDCLRVLQKQIKEQIDD